MQITKQQLDTLAIEELKKLLNDGDKKIKLRAISLSLRHSNKAPREDTNPELTKSIDDALKAINFQIKDL